MQDPYEGKFLVRVEGVFDSQEEADAAMSDMEDKIGLHNGELIDSNVSLWEEA